MRVEVVETMGRVATAGREAEPELDGAERGELVDARGIAGEVLPPAPEWQPQRTGHSWRGTSPSTRVATTAEPAIARVVGVFVAIGFMQSELACCCRRMTGLLRHPVLIYQALLLWQCSIDTICCIAMVPIGIKGI